ncbi:MAG: CehA/McbA family metallohydrolase [Acidobacteria bacterium]|nr:CehA/McbA family metallohydrolase [Acidobacteriota bacterium]
MIWAVLALLLQAPAVTQDVSRDVVLSGVVGITDKGTYQEHEFDVPTGITRLDFTFTHAHKEVGAQLEVGVFDPTRFRGTSRFSKTDFYIADGHATPSYHAGSLPAGRWRISLGIPALGPAPQVEWQVTVKMSARSPHLAPAQAQAATGTSAPRWFVGDFHAHTLHSDGFGCHDSETPTITRGCHTWEIVEAARARALNFVAITDHNTTSHHIEMAALQHTVPELVLVRGQELTTFHGHANVYGTSAFIDFRLGFGGRHITQVVADIARAGGLLSINHPGRLTGDRCTGCGWDAPGTPWSDIGVMEVVNGTTTDGPTSGLWFWHARLNEGHRLTGIGGSDDHAVRSTRTRLATPTTVVFATGLSETEILAGVRTGRVYIRTRGPEGPSVDLSMDDAGTTVHMGGTLLVTVPGTRTLRINTTAAAGHEIDIVQNGEVIATHTVPGDAAVVTTEVPVAPDAWINVRLRDGKGITAISNPIYLRRR